MTIAALQKRVKNNISLIENKLILEKINQLIDENSKIYELSDKQMEQVEKARKQIISGDFLTQEEMDSKVEVWLNEK